MAYDVFISYRRATGVDDARLLQQALKARGYDVFFDYASLRDGRFNEKIFESIDSAPVFILMMTEHSLDRCAEEGDWVRMEIERAIGKGRKIILVAPTSQEWSFPDNLPGSLRNIPKEQVSQMDKASLFEESIDKIVKERFPDELKRKRRSSQNTPCTVTNPSHLFYGRDAELASLHELLAAGKAPVVTGPGGTGKSELVFQYAKRYRADYPGGLFQIDMETVKSWDEAFQRLLSSPGANIRSLLDLPRNHDDDGTDARRKEISTAEIAGALKRRVGQTGRILLVLDNVESPKALFTETILAKLSLLPDVSIVATARVCDANLRPTDSAAELRLDDLSPDAALAVLLADRPEADADERKAAMRVADLLGYRALYLRRVPALIGDLDSQTVYDSYTELAKALEENILEMIAEKTEKTHLPDVLWEMTRERLLRMPFGAECVKLVQVASFFSPEGFPQHILKHLWKTVVAPNLDEKKFIRVLELARYHGVFQSEDPIRIHRLDREAILQSVKGESWLQDAVGKSLATYEGMSPKDWLLLSDNLQIVSHAPTSALDVHLGDYWKDFEWGIRFAIRSCTYLWLKLLLKNAEYSFYLPWDRLDGDDWVKLLEERPEYGDICSWDKLCERNWRDLLAKQPQFAACCRLTKGEGDGIGDNSIEKRQQAEYVRIGGDRDDWVNLLKKQPQSFEGCPWEEFCGRNWADLLESQPQFAKKCIWDKLDGSDWTSLLKSRPQFANECRWIKLNGEDWSRLLTCQPRFADGCPWELLEGSDWGSLLAENQDQLFVDKCQWELLDGADWSKLLYYQPRFYDKCAWAKLKSADWVALLLGQPQFASRCRWDEFCGSDWVRLLSQHPSFANRCAWDKLKSEDWARLLSMQPQFADKCPWEDIDGCDWVRILSVHPSFADKCEWKRICDSGITPDAHQRPSLSEGETLSAHAGWLELVCCQPQFVDVYPWPWGNLTAQDWIWLLIHGSRSQDEALVASSGTNDMNPLEHIVADMCKWDEFDGESWCVLLRECPRFADKCNWEKLTGCDWESLLCKQPQFVDKCSWEKLTGDDWEHLLSSSPQFSGKYAWREKLDGRNWARLLRYQPQFDDRCDWGKLSIHDWFELLYGFMGDGRSDLFKRSPWKKFDVYQWKRLLSVWPQFAEKCPWGKFDGSDWASLLESQPQFAKDCPWGKLVGSDWAYLLATHPQFAEKCDDYGKLSGEDWAHLLAKHPQFAEKCDDLGKLTGENWADFLVEGHGRFSHIVPWDKLNGAAWVILLESIWGENDEHLISRCPWGKLNSWDWACLLSRRPEFASEPRCPWEKFEGDDWAKLIANQPQFVERCPRDLFDGRHWAFILSFAEDTEDLEERCPWNLLSGWNWAVLLSRSPKFADRCNWELLDGFAWERLLSEQPGFLDKCPWKALWSIVVWKLLFVAESSWKTIAIWMGSKVKGKRV